MGAGRSPQAIHLGLFLMQRLFIKDMETDLAFQPLFWHLLLDGVESNLKIITGTMLCGEPFLAPRVATLALKGSLSILHQPYHQISYLLI